MYISLQGTAGPRVGRAKTNPNDAARNSHARFRASFEALSIGAHFWVSLHPHFGSRIGKMAVPVVALSLFHFRVCFRCVF